MIDNLIAFSIKNKLIIGIFTIAMVIWGIFSFKDIPIDAVPDITNNQVQVITLSPTLAAQEVEQFITLPIEIAMANIPDVVEIRSISRFGISVITVVFEENKDIYLARQLITEQLKMAEEEIPEGLGNPELAPISTGLGEILQYVLYADEGYEDQYSAMDLRTINDWIVKRQLAGIPGIVEVNGWGGFLKEYEISVNPEKLKSMDITIADVYAAVQNNNENTGGSYIEKKFNTYFIRAEGLVSSLEDIEKIVVKTVQNTPIFIRDVAEVKYGSAPRYGAVTRNGHGEVVVGIAMMLKGENSDKVITDVKERITTIRGSLPEGVVLEPFLDRSELIGRSMNTVTKNLVEGGLIVIFILIMLLGNFRAGLIVASVIPLSMMFAIAMMRLFGVSANLMSLGAIDFGLIVDGAVIIVESIVHRLKTNFSGQKLTASQMNKEVKLSSQKIRKSAAFGEIIILMVYIPILALVGIEGKMFKPMAQTVSFAILGALILSLTYVPMMSAFFLSKKIHSRVTLADRIIGRLQKWYSPVIELALRFKAVVIILTLVLFGMSVFTFSRMGGEFIPTLEEGDFALHQILPPGTSLAQGIEISTKLETILKEKFPEVDMVVTKIGSAEIPTDPMPIEVGDIMVKMKPKSEWVTASTREEMFEKMEKELSVVPGVGFEFTQPIQMRFNELMTGVRQDIAVKIYGEDLNLLYSHAKEAESIINGIQGVGDIKVEQVVGMPQIIIDYDRSKVAQYGLNVKELNTLVRTAFAGEKAGVVFENERRFDIVVRLESEYRNNIDDIRNLYVALPNGSQVPLKEVANIDFKEAPMQISRDNTKRRITIGINARNRDVETLVEEIQDKLEAELVLPAGYYLKYGGQFENLVAAKKRLSIAVPITLALIFILLFFTFNSIKQALLIFSAIPLAAIGGVYALWLRDMPFSISAGVGFIALFGVAVLNGIVLIAYFNQLKKEGMTDIRERILTGTNIRLRPVIMTASVAAFGFLPMAISQSAGAEVQRPLATVVIGGLITATFLTLVVLPVLYSIFTERIHIGEKTINTILILIFAGTLALPISSNAQQILTMDDAVQLAIANNPKLKAANLEVEKQQVLTNTVLDFDNTEFAFGFGELNSTAFDFEVNISQGFKMPKVYKQRSELQNQNIVLSDKKLKLTKHELSHNVRSAYMNLEYSQARKQLIAELDDIYESFMEAVEKKRKAGESNALEKIASQTKVQEVKLMMHNADAEISIARQELQKWLNSSEPVGIDKVAFTKLILVPTDNSSENHPALDYYQQSIRVTEQAQQLEKTDVLPEFSIGYFNKQIDGVTGFDGVEAGVSLPIWRKAHKAKLQASDIDIQIARTEYENAQLQLSLMIEKKRQEYTKYEQMVSFYENESLKLSEELIRVATKNYRVREIDYMDYIRNLEQAIEIKTKYLDALNGYNQLVIDMWYLEGK